MRKFINIVVAVLIITGGLAVVHQVNVNNQQLHLKKIELQNNETKLNKLEQDYLNLGKQKALTEQQVKDLDNQKQQLEQEKARLQQQLQARAELKKRQAVVYAEAPSSSYHGSGDSYLDWIISHESGGNPHAMNSIGACGLGQSLPCSKVLSVCGTLDNVDCQIQWVRNYCISRYGSTYQAYLFWQQNHWF